MALEILKTIEGFAKTTEAAATLDDIALRHKNGNAIFNPQLRAAATVLAPSKPQTPRPL